MIAILIPLRDKYYGTKIYLYFEDGYEHEIITLNDPGDFTPSERELAKHGFTVEQWDNNEEVDNGFGGKTEIKKMDLICSGHFESRLTYERALKLIRRVNTPGRMDI